MATRTRRSLFLLNILPCPGPERCDFHASIFGRRNDLSDTPREYSCQRCRKPHPTTITPSSTVNDTHSLTPLESLPTELLQYITSNLPADDATCLTLASRALCRKLGTKIWDQIPRGSITTKWIFLRKLARDMPGYAPCLQCSALRPSDSNFAWPLLRLHREERGIKPTFYFLSQFLISKVLVYVEAGQDTGICPEFLACKGSFRKAVSQHERSTLEGAGFGEEDVERGLRITYQTELRREKDMFNSNLISHVVYRIPLPKSWNTFSISQRYAILRDFYLCPHTYASKVQYRDPEDPTYPADSSIVHWFPEHEPVPDGTCLCSECQTEFRSSFGEREMVIDVWHRPVEACNDGLKETVHCLPSHRVVGIGYLRERFESAKPV